MDLKSALQIAFDLAENETAAHYGGATCSMPNSDGGEDCPICYFRGRVRIYLSELLDANLTLYEEERSGTSNS